MNHRATKFLALLLLSASVSELAAQEGNPGQRRLDLPYRRSPHALGGHDRADLRREWNLFWFGGKASPAYLDYKNQLAEQQTRLWAPRRLQGAGPLAQPLIQPLAQPLAGTLPSALATGPAGIGGVWTNLGPFSQLTSTTPDIDSGRPVAIVAHPTAPTLYLATSGGGVFRCDNADPASTTDWTWYSVTDALPTSSSGGNVSVGALAMSPVDPNTLYMGAGDFFDAEGRGFFKTTDGGATWTAAPLSSLGTATRSYAILPLDANRVLWATNAGLRISTDGGSTFVAATGGPATGQVWSLQKVTATDLLCSVEVTSGTTSTANIHYSTNAGASWTPATLPSLTFTPGRITIRAAGDGTTAYAILEDTTNSSSTTMARGVLKSVDKGATWTWLAAPTVSGGLFQGTGPQMSGDGGQGWYNHGLAVDPNNPLRVFVGANLALYRSVDGGLSWVQLTHWFGSGHVYAHADFHATAWSPNGATLYVGNDGGLAVVRDPFRVTIPTISFDTSFLDNRRNKGLASHLVYNVGSTAALSPSDSKWRISLGMQDNGTRLRQPAVSGGTLTGTEGTFEDEIGGDGFATLFHPGDGTQVLGSIYYTDIYRSTNGGGSFSESISGIVEAKNKDLAPFAPKLVPGDAARPAAVYTSTNGKIYLSTSFGASWVDIGTGGLPAPLDTSSTTTNTTNPELFIRNLAASASDPNTLGIAANQSRVYLTSSGGSSWTKGGTLPGSASYLSCIEFDRTTPTTVYVGSVAPTSTANHLWKSINGGGSWTAIDGSPTASNGFPFGIPVHVVKADPLVANKVYVGTDFGVYVTSDGGATWSRFGSNLPLVATRDLYIAPDDSFLRAATFGRGVWELQTAQVSVSLDRTTATVNPSTSTTFTATVTNYTADNKVNWTVSAGGGGVSPTQTASGSAATYTAPATPGVYTVTAASNEAPSASASATVSVYNPASVTVSVSPATASLLAGGTATFSATVTNAPSQGVSWSASGGTITAGGVYTAPAAAGTYTITAASIWPGTTSGTASVTVKSLDLNGDGVVDLRDLLFFAKFYGTTNPTCDLNGDGTVDDKDLAILLGGL
ncbi:dockerin type I domain-containing protein [Geothrix paludis]|uniref:dockerin type I domain-containing protein n=1 Tax=Geothrix paludis TaxID=2922722 RepID=UPI001FADB5C2|nr:dockerin type I domain-containing protein [Geothrix paludis]